VTQLLPYLGGLKKSMAAIVDRLEASVKLNSATNSPCRAGALAVFAFAIEHLVQVDVVQCPCSHKTLTVVSGNIAVTSTACEAHPLRFLFLFSLVEIVQTTPAAKHGRHYYEVSFSLNVELT
jgi:hypothetical protein